MSAGGSVCSKPMEEGEPEVATWNPVATMPGWPSKEGEPARVEGYRALVVPAGVL